MTVEDRFHVHSLHAYFIRPGDADQPIHFDVARSRDGRSFCTRSVVASQEGAGVILTMSLSFQIDESGHDVQAVSMPPVPPPEELSGYSWSPMFKRRFAELRNVEEGRGVAWLKMRDAIGDDRILQACALAYLSDDLPTDALVSLLLPGQRLTDGEDDHGLWSASLDHAIWFHRPMRADRWQLQDFTCHGLISSRGLAVGHVFDEDGVHVATISQEVLLRRRGD